MNKSKFFWAIVLIVGGLLWIADIYGLIDISNLHLGRILVPLLMCCAGLGMLLKSFDRNHYNGADRMEEVEPGNECDVFMAGRSMNFQGKRFNGMKVKALMGGVKIDLRGAIIEDGAVMNVNAMMGGVEIYLPLDVNVDVRSHCTLGGVDCKNHTNVNTPQATLIIEASCMMGGVEIK